VTCISEVIPEAKAFQMDRVISQKGRSKAIDSAGVAVRRTREIDGNASSILLRYYVLEPMR